MKNNKKRDPTKVLADRVFKWYRKHAHLIPPGAKWKVSSELLNILGTALPEKPKPAAGIVRWGTWHGNA